MNKNPIPVFYHIPKNSGTYIYTNISNSIRSLYYRKIGYNIREIIVMDGHYMLIRFLVNDMLYSLDNCEYASFVNKNLSCNCINICKHKIIWTININDINSNILNNLQLLAVIIEPRGFKCSEKILEMISNLFQKYNLYKFLILRNPFEREQSLFNYITSEASKHEPTHKVITSNTFEEYIMSNQLQDSWLIRNLLNLKTTENLNEEHYTKTCEILKSFNVYDIKDTEKCLKEMFLKCFGDFSIEYNKKRVEKNTNLYSKIEYKDLSENVKNKFKEILLSASLPELSKFKEIKYWDQKLYDTFFSNSVLQED